MIVPAGLPDLQLPSLHLDLLDEIAGAAAGLALVSFSSMMLTARSFAAKNRYQIDTDREFAALGRGEYRLRTVAGFRHQRRRLAHCDGRRHRAGGRR